MYFKLHLGDYPTLELAFAAIPPDSTTLDLSRNNLGHLTGERLADIFSRIPVHIHSINLRDNYLSDRTADELAHAFSRFSPCVTSLNLSFNTLVKKSGSKLSKALSGIPQHVRIIDLSENSLNIGGSAALLEALPVLTAGTTVILKHNHLFKPDNTHTEKDVLLTQLRQANLNINLDITYNGESDVQRTMAPLACFAKKPVIKHGRPVPTDALIHTLSFLLPKNTSITQLHEKFLDASKIVDKNQSENDFTPIGHPIMNNNTYKP